MSRQFESMQDVWDVVDLLIEEVKDHNSKGKSFDVNSSVNAQLPFFTCKNLFYSKQYSKDIRKYVYCQDFNTPPYPGSYGEQPVLWLEKAIIIKNVLAKLSKDNLKDGNRK